MKKKIKPIEVVERYHKKYLEYEAAYNKNPIDQERLQKEIMSIVDKYDDFEDEKFQNEIVEIAIEKPQRASDVEKAAIKFCLYTDFYYMTNEEPLPKNIQEDYDKLPVKKQMNPFYSIEAGEFVKNETKDIGLSQEYFKDIFNQLKNA